MAPLTTAPDWQRPGSARSSITFEGQEAENEIRQYGRDETEDLPTKSSRSPSLVHGKDPNLVQWDGPDDPENPQNWSARRKWLMIVVVTLMSVNVCVFISHCLVTRLT